MQQLRYGFAEMEPKILLLKSVLVVGLSLQVLVEIKYDAVSFTPSYGKFEAAFVVVDSKTGQTSLEHIFNFQI